MSQKLAIILSHPVQYYSPLFRELSKTKDIVVFYGYHPNQDEQGKSGFGIAFSWDIDLLSGYKYIFLKNQSKSSSFNQFNGISVPDIGSAIKKENITHVLILGWQYKFYLQALMFCKINKIPVSVRGDSQLGMQSNVWIKFVKRLIYPIFLGLYTCIFYVGNRNKEYLRNYFVPKKKLIFSPHAIDQKFWSNTTYNEPVRSGAIEFIWVGKFIEKKRPLDVLKAFERAEKMCEGQIKLRLVGTGALLEECKLLYSKNDRIIFDGFKNQTELRTIYTNADCIILSSNRKETWGLVINEAFACNVPAIVADGCGCSADLIDDSTGLIYPTGKIDELVNSILRMTKTLQMDSNYYKEGIKIKNSIYSYGETVKNIDQFLSL